MGDRVAKWGSDKDSAICETRQPNLRTAADGIAPSAAPIAPNITVTTVDQAFVGRTVKRITPLSQSVECVTRRAFHFKGPGGQQCLQDYRESVGRDWAIPRAFTCFF